MESKVPKDRIYILGIGNLGRLFACALAIKEDPPPITLLFHRASQKEEWIKAGSKIEITAGGRVLQSGSFDVEVMYPGKNDYIKHLIVTTKTTTTASAIDMIKHRLTSTSTILFCQNGMGTVEEDTLEIFSKVATRPQFAAAVTSHGVYSLGPFRSVQVGKANIVVSRIKPEDAPANSIYNLKDPSYIINEVVNAPALSATEVEPVELIQLQLEKLVVNSVINPLSAIFRRKNGDLFTNPTLTKFMTALVKEASEVILSLPEVNIVPSAKERFTRKVLEQKVLSVAEKTAGNRSSMLQDMNAGKETEIEYINGWIIRKGTKMGISCAAHESVYSMVKGRSKLEPGDVEILVSGSLLDE